MSDQKVETLTINNTVYDIKSVTETGVKLVNTVKRMEAIIEDYEAKMKTAEIAKERVFADLLKEAENFVVIQKDEDPDVKPADDKADYSQLR